LIPWDPRLDQYWPTGVVHAMDGKDILGKVDSDGHNRHGLPLLLVLMNVENFIMAR
jgi:transposase